MAPCGFVQIVTFSYIRGLAVSDGLNELFQILDWTLSRIMGAHKRDLTWLNAQVAALEGCDIMIFTHGVQI